MSDKRACLVGVCANFLFVVIYACVIGMGVTDSPGYYKVAMAIHSLFTALWAVGYTRAAKSAERDQE